MAQGAGPTNAPPSDPSDRPRGAIARLVQRGARLRIPRRVWTLVGAGLSILIIMLTVVAVWHTLTTVKYAQLRAAMQATGIDQIAVAGLFVALSYLALTGYDAVALRQLKLRVPYRTTALASFTSYAISFTLGFPLITAGTVRYWIYAQAGLSAGRVASLTVIAGVTFWLGMIFLIGVALAFDAPAISAINHLDPALNVLIGVGALLILAAYLVWVGRGHRQTHIQGLTLELPGLGLTLGQIGLGILDLCSAAAALFWLLPDGTPIDYPAFTAVYVFASLMGIASNVPGGIGAFEATMLNAVPAPSQEQMLASLLVFRVIYYLVPFVLALALLGAHEAVRRWRGLRTAMRIGGGS